jgi:hypothetical protein
MAIVATTVMSMPAPAQDATRGNSGSAAASAARTDTAPAASMLVQETRVQYFRPMDKRGLNMFETPKVAGVPFNGFALQLGASFTQQFQSLAHSNDADERLVSGVNSNSLMVIGDGFNNATANLYLNAQVAPGIRVALTSYLSSRHHNETWVKDGYILIDESPFDLKLLNDIMSVTTLRIGHFEINYGDAHFRRSDNGNAMYNPFVGNLITDAFTTEVGAEVYLRKYGLLAMGAVGE